MICDSVTSSLYILCTAVQLYIHIHGTRARYTQNHGDIGYSLNSRRSTRPDVSRYCIYMCIYSNYAYALWWDHEDINQKLRFCVDTLVSVTTYKLHMNMSHTTHTVPSRLRMWRLACVGCCVSPARLGHHASRSDNVGVQDAHAVPGWAVPAVCAVAVLTAALPLHAPCSMRTACASSLGSGKWDFPLVSHIRFFGGVVVRFPK